MNSYTKVLISTVAAFATQTAASGIHNSCLSLSDNTIGQPDFVQQFVTNESTLTSGAVSSDMSLDGFTVCTDGDNVVGLQFFLTETPYLVDAYAPLTSLEPIGTMTGNCGSLRFSGPVDQVKAASKNNKGLQGISFHYEDKIVAIGDLEGRKVQTDLWTFTDEKALVGVYGESSPNGIEKLGMITLDLACQAVLDAAGSNDQGDEEKTGEPVDIDFVPVDEATLIPNDANEMKDSIIFEESTDADQVNFDKLDNIDTIEPQVARQESSGMAVSTWLIIIFATVGLLVMVALTVVALKRGMKAKGEQNEATAVVTPTKQQQKKTENDIENSNGYTSGAAFQSPDQSKQ